MDAVLLAIEIARRRFAFLDKLLGGAVAQRREGDGDRQQGHADHRQHRPVDGTEVHVLTLLSAARLAGRLPQPI